MKKRFKSIGWIVLVYVLVHIVRNLVYKYVAGPPGFLHAIFDGFYAVVHAFARAILGGGSAYITPNTRFYDIGFFIGITLFIIWIISDIKDRGDDGDNGFQDEPETPPGGGRGLKQPRRRRKTIRIGGRLRRFDMDIMKN